MSEPVAVILQRHPFVEEFQPHHIEKLASMATRVRFERDQVIFREGDECGEFYLIISGLLALEIAAPDHTLRVQTLAAGDELGWSAILMGRRKHFQARAHERPPARARSSAPRHWPSMAANSWSHASRIRCSAMC
jgi:CRP-like cAMP-binding protein